MGSVRVCDPRETRAAISSASFPYPQKVAWGKYNAASLYVDLKTQRVPRVIRGTTVVREFVLDFVQNGLQSPLPSCRDGALIGSRVCQSIFELRLRSVITRNPDNIAVSRVELCKICSMVT